MVGSCNAIEADMPWPNCVVEAERGTANGAGRAVVKRRPPEAITDIFTTGPGEDHIGESADYAVLGRGARIDGEVHTSAAGEVIAKPVPRTIRCAILKAIIVAGVGHHVGAQIAAELDAGISARHVVETGTIQGADPHVFDRFGLYGKISCLCPAHGDQTRR